MDLNEILANIASRVQPYPEVDDAPVGARRIQLIDEPFVEPDLTKELSGSDATPQVYLIFAPAAVGKSVLAREIARRSGNPYWNLAAFRLGSSFFIGTVSKAYGKDRTDDFVQQLSSGDITLVLDGADEAAVGATSSAYLEAINDLASLLGMATPRAVQAVILGREETIRQTADRLQELGVSFAVLSVRYFSESSARQFVEVLAKDGGSSHLLPDFADFVDEFFSRVRAALRSSSWADCESFLGYAPVLDSVAAFYRLADNPYVRLREFTASDTRLAIWELLHDLIESLMVRESDKFADSFGGDNQSKRSFALTAYTLEQQCRLLLAADPSALDIDPELTDETDVEWLSYIKEGVLNWFGQHAFTPAFASASIPNPMKRFANAAFRDFVVAYASSMTDASVAIAASEYMHAHDVSPSLILSRFIEVRARRGLISRIPGDLLAPISESHAASDDDQAALWIIEHALEGPESTESTAVGIVYPADNGHASPVSVIIDLEDGTIVLGRHIAKVVVIAPTREVAIGNMYPETQLGPSALIRCETFGSRSPEVRVVGADHEQVVVEAHSIGGNARLIHGFAGSLALRIPAAAYPWQRFRAEAEANSALTRVDLLALALDYRTIWDWFSQGSGTFEAAKMDSILSKGRASRRMFGYCESEDEIWRDGTNYRFRSSISHLAVRSADTEDQAYRSFLTGAWRFYYR